MRTASSSVALVALVALLAASAGCGDHTTSVLPNGESSSSSGSLGGSVDEDERGSIGVPPSADDYCRSLGYVLGSGTCTFPDGSSCNEWAFYRGECGQAHSYCNRHGGSISMRTKDMGTWTAIVGVCARDGKECPESTFYKTGTCE